MSHFRKSVTLICDMDVINDYSSVIFFAVLYPHSICACFSRTRELLLINRTNKIGSRSDTDLIYTCMSSAKVCEVGANQEYVDSQSDKKVLISSNNILFFHLFLISMSSMLNLFLRRYLK